MSKCYSKFTYGFVASAALFVAGGAFAQCDSNSGGDFTDTESDHSDCSPNAGVDDNGGWNQIDPVTGDYMYLDAGAYNPGENFRVKGVVGTYNSSCDGGDNNARDLDWILFEVTDACFVTVTLSMSDATGTPMDGVNTYDLIFMEQGGVTGPDSAIDLVGEYGFLGCPHNVIFTYPNGSQQSRFPVDAGELLIIVTTPFDSALDSPYAGPLSYGLDVAISAYDNASCITATNDCITTSVTGGCSDGACCENVCGFRPSCCDSAWDAVCVDDGVTTCGNFIYTCDAPWIGASNDCVGSATPLFGFPAFVSFDCTQANTDGPNDVVNLCSSSYSHDVWYIVGPTPSSGEVRTTMCGQGNTGDAVVSLYNLGESNEIGDPQDLPSKYVACRDDVCDDDGDGEVDPAGPAGINLIGVPANTYWLVRVGSFYDKDLETQADGFAGTMEITFRAVFVDHGLQQLSVEAGVSRNFGYSSGDVSPNPKRWMMVPFEMTQSGSVDGFDFPAFDSSSPDVISWKFINRNILGGAYGEFGRPFGSTGEFDQGQVVAEGSVAHDFVNDWSDVGDSIGERHFLDIETPFTLEAGSYYFTCYGEYADGSSGASFAWCAYGADSMVQQTTAQVVIDSGNAAGASSVGTWPAGTPFGWRGIGAGPKMCFYSLGVSVTTQLADAPGKLYGCAFNLKGQLAAACFGDLDGSGEVDSGDVSLCLLDTGPCAGCPADLDGSQEVDSGDVSLVLLSTGACQ